MAGNCAGSWAKLLDECSEQERGWVSHLRGCVQREGGRAGLSGEQQQEAGGEGERWLETMREAELLRQPLVFSRAHATIELSENGGVATRTEEGDGNMKRPAMSDVIMRSLLLQVAHCKM